jgi:beta-glucanase (GH16 family)
MDTNGNANPSEELECYRQSQVALDGGYLSLTAVEGVCAGGYSGQNYVSGAVFFAQPLTFQYGTIEYRARMSGAQGMWPALWMLGYQCQPSSDTIFDNGCNWPYPGSDEIDITEILNSNFGNVNEQIHSSLGNPGCTANVSDTGQNFHIYDLVWTANQVSWLIDGVTQCVQTTAVPQDPMFLIINVAVGGQGGAVDNNQLPSTLFVDYVRVTQP